MSTHTPLHTGPILAPPSDEDAALGKLFVQFIGGVFGFCLLLLAAGVVFRDPMMALSEGYVSTFGGPGLLAAWAALDFVPFPVFPQDAFMALALLGGMGFWATGAWSVAGSLLGGIISFGFGRWLGKREWYLATTRRGVGQRVAGLIARNRIMTLALCAVSPLPYSTGAWACGATNMPLQTFLLVSLLRFPRILLYLWLIQIGAINFLQG
ncbi:MAG: VTT domain-containing protein [Myxococcota bacterium]